MGLEICYLVSVQGSEAGKQWCVPGCCKSKSYGCLLLMAAVGCSVGSMAACLCLKQLSLSASHILSQCMPLSLHPKQPLVQVFLQ